MKLKHTAFTNFLKQDKKAQEAILRLAKSKDWIVLRHFVAKVKASHLESTLEADDLSQIQRYKYLIRGMERIVKSPEAIKLIQEEKKKGKVQQVKDKAEKMRIKYAPGAWGRKE